MTPACLLIDLQNDYLAAAELQPAAGAIVSRAAALLAECRARGIPVLHVWTTVQRHPDNRMPHWKAAGTWICIAGTAGHDPPPPLRPLAHERVLHKQFFSAFGNPDLESVLRSLGCDTLLLAGVHLHACVRATALDGYARGFVVRIADDAVGSDDPLHAAITRRYLRRRGTRFDPVDRILKDPSEAHAEPPIEEAVAGARSAWPVWRQIAPSDRGRMLGRLADRLDTHRDELAEDIVVAIGMPLTMALTEVRGAAAACRAMAGHTSRSRERRPPGTARWRPVPLGVVAVVTPWNAPLAFPLGKIAAALSHGNTVVWAPAPCAAAIGERTSALLKEVMPPGVITLCPGDHAVAHSLAEHRGIDAVAMTGSSAANLALEDLCARRGVPLQAELDGHGASIVWDDTELSRAAGEIARGAFAFAGQHRTAHRRVIIAASVVDAFLEALTRAAAALPWGDPSDPRTVVGPLINATARDNVMALLQRARDAGCHVITPHAGNPGFADLLGHGAYHPPAIVRCDDPGHEVARGGIYGPVLAVHPAHDFDQAIDLLHAVRQGRVATLFSLSRRRREQFLAEARAGVLTLDRVMADAETLSPLGGETAPHIGTVQHARGDRVFFCRAQTIHDH